MNDHHKTTLTLINNKLKMKLNNFLYSISMIILIYQLISVLCNIHILLNNLSEIIISWPYEIIYIVSGIIYIITFKIYHVYVINLKKLSNNVSTILLIMMIPSIIFIGFSMLSCNLLKYRQMTSTTTTTNLLTMNNNNYRLNDQNYRYLNNIKPIISNNIYHIMTMSIYDKKNFIKTSWDKVQNKYHCCGSKGPNDWILLRKKIPISCCYYNNIKGMQFVNDDADECEYEDVHPNGCEKILQTIIYQKMETLDIILLFMMILEILLFILVAFYPTQKYQKKLKNKNFIIKYQEPISIIGTDKYIMNDVV